jgi:beta-xylosidase
MAGHGRLPYLQPAGWKDGWPWMGANVNAAGAGEIAWQLPKPKTGASDPLTELCEPDDFVSAGLGPHWRWNHNPRPQRYSLSEHPGWLRLYADLPETEPGEDGVHQPVPYHRDSLIFAHNTLVQLPVGKHCQGTTVLNVSGMETGQRAGLCLFNKDYLWIGVIQEGGERHLWARTDETHWEGPQLNQDLIWLRATIEDGAGRVAYSLDGRDFKPLGPGISLSVQWFEAHKFGLFSYTLTAGAGYADFDGFWQGNLE